MNIPSAYKLYGMKLFDEMTVGRFVRYIRVPGGWVYMETSDGGDEVAVFIPYSDEFKS